MFLPLFTRPAAPRHATENNICQVDTNHPHIALLYGRGDGKTRSPGLWRDHNTAVRLVALAVGADIRIFRQCGMDDAPFMSRQRFEFSLLIALFHLFCEIDGALYQSI